MFQDECADLMELIVDRINNRDAEFLSHILLSIFKMAEIEIVPVETSGAFHPDASRLFTLTTFLTIVKIIQNYLTIS